VFSIPQSKDEAVSCMLHSQAGTMLRQLLLDRWHCEALARLTLSQPLRVSPVRHAGEGVCCCTAGPSETAEGFKASKKGK
jgi:hypothetical protein